MCFEAAKKQSQSNPNKANLISVRRSADSVWIPAFTGMTNNKYLRLSALICG